MIMNDERWKNIDFATADICGMDQGLDILKNVEIFCNMNHNLELWQNNYQNVPYSFFIFGLFNYALLTV
jgi:hypothetical protein